MAGSYFKVHSKHLPGESEENPQDSGQQTQLHNSLYAALN
jgi:hypothetical protein